MTYKRLETLLKEGFDLDSEYSTVERKWMDILLKMFAVSILIGALFYTIYFLKCKKKVMKCDSKKRLRLILFLSCSLLLEQIENTVL